MGWIEERDAAQKELEGRLNPKPKPAKKPAAKKPAAKKKDT
jgi:hypothetical protein